MDLRGVYALWFLSIVTSCAFFLQVRRKREAGEGNAVSSCYSISDDRNELVSRTFRNVKRNNKAIKSDEGCLFLI